MFETLTEKLQVAFTNLRGKKTLSEDDVTTALGEIRRALLEADVNYKVVRDFVAAIRERATGVEVMEGLNPAQQVVKIVDEELTVLLGGADDDNSLHFAQAGQGPTVIMMVGLQGSGKTTHCGKLSRHLRKNGKKPLLVACDIYRPAAIKQLEVVGGQVETPVFTLGDQVDPAQIAQKAVAQAKQNGNDVVIIDTAGRLQIDEPLMKELARVKKAVQPTEILLVLDSMTGQEAVNVAKGFHDELGITGFILTKLDSDTRGGAALSLRSVASAPIKFMGVGEKMDALEIFHPDRMASRILGMGDVLSLIERAEQAIDAKDAADLEKKLRQNSFDFNDFLDQMRQMKKLGPLNQVLGMLPGIGAQLKNVDIDERRLARVEAMILSMTKEERRDPDLLSGSRRRRVAIGSGMTIQDVNRLISQFADMRKMMRGLMQMKDGQGKGKPGGFPGMGAPQRGGFPGLGSSPFGGGFGGQMPGQGMPGRHAAGKANKKKQKGRGGNPFGR
jgi:signal recognition particle subunit SRP54